MNDLVCKVTYKEGVKTTQWYAPQDSQEVFLSGMLFMGFLASIIIMPLVLL